MVWIAPALGLLTGLHISTWGLYKDAPFEGYSWLRYGRSTLIAVALSLIAYPLCGMDLHKPGKIVVFWGLVYVLERAVTEYWKTFLRNEDQAKYFIPMRFHIGGKVVQNPRIRVAVAIAYASGLAMLVWGVHVGHKAGLGTELWAVLLIGSAGGWISALGGAWKDAPLEGFEVLKFFRSPGLATLYAFLMSQFTDNLMLITFPALGYTIASIETYKTFLRRGQSVGKFAGKPVRFPEVLKWRWFLGPIYTVIWLILISICVLALVSPQARVLVH